MRTNSNGTAGVSIIIPKKSGHVYEALFNHPLEKKRVRRSLGTPDGSYAKSLAIKLSNLLQTPSDWKNPPSALRHIWHGKRGMNPFLVRRGYDRDIIGEQEKTPKTPLEIEANEAMDTFLEDNKKYPTEFIEASMEPFEAAHEIHKLISERDAAVAELAECKAELASCRGLLSRVGLDNARATTVSLKDSITEFLASGHGGGERFADRMKCALEGFSEFAGETTRAGEITPDRVCEYLKLKSEVAAGGRLKTVGQQICRWLGWSTGGTFRRQPVDDWLRRNAKTVSSTPYWLDASDVEKLIDALPEKWRPVAWLQWASGVRPEELSRIESRNLREVAGEMSVRVGKIVRDGKLFWEPKTKRSVGTVNLPTWANRPLSKLVDNETSSGFLFENNGQPWGLDEFCREYRAVLEPAAKLAELDSDRVDGRTLRRSCGKRVLLASLQKGVGNAIEITAAVLRDHPATVRAHYADLLPSDVRQPE